MVVGMESGPNGIVYPPGFSPEFWGFGPGFGQTALGQAASVSAIAGIAATAMGALSMMRNGQQIPIVLTDLTSTLQNPRVVRIR